MSFSGNWHTLLEAAEELSPDATLITPLSHTNFRITDTQEHRVIIEILDSDASQPLQRDQFETVLQVPQDPALERPCPPMLPGLRGPVRKRAAEHLRNGATHLGPGTDQDTNPAVGKRR